MTGITISEAGASRPGTVVPRREGREELVPSRYALQVGEINVLVISDGVLPLPTTMLAHNVEPTVRAAWLGDMFLPSTRFSSAVERRPSSSTPGLGLIRTCTCPEPGNWFSGSRLPRSSSPRSPMWC